MDIKNGVLSRDKRFNLIFSSDWFSLKHNSLREKRKKHHVDFSIHLKHLQVTFLWSFHIKQSGHVKFLLLFMPKIIFNNAEYKNSFKTKA